MFAGKTIRLLSAVLLFSFTTSLFAQSSDEILAPFKVGTFSINGSAELGLVFRDALIVELDAANASLENAGMVPEIPMPDDMIDLIERYEYGLKRRLYEIANYLVLNDLLDIDRPAWIHVLDTIDTLPPIMYPGKIMNAAVNFYTHVNETGTPEEIAASRRERRENRGAPYLFLKPTRGAVIGDGDSVVIPYGRTQTDWEVELGTVIGKAAKYVSAEEAQDYIFGYMVTMDISDRGGRPPGGFQGVDWFVGKGHDTFAPMGPWIVPKEFYGDPMEKLRQTLSIGDEQMQEATAGDMIHSLYELIEYASSLITLYPGDVLNNGTSGGVGMGTSVRGEQRFLQDGEVIEASIDGIGSLRVNVVAEEARPRGTGAQLPPVNSYRD
ncbi:MAG: fumarylacetoacetate hydrolase family protein [Gammaproteobacteria bacterium]|jgi:2-keto-4-pentenoate hydratase/2-oxohepta-3-ene-1,7-dioic acid hydratase in catechol pathway|nr:fumarylacetoacetate hydrolase family protein [Gammaproteobacteria bacterium]MBT6042228.1 fumarylacetoacetate hydrolase family protein [Gammaproteobacteria bacterium]